MPQIGDFQAKKPEKFYDVTKFGQFGLTGQAENAIM